MHNSTLTVTWQAKNATQAWKMLNGVVALYKPAGVHFLQLRQTLQVKICNGLNSLKVRPPRPYVELEGDTTKEMKVTVRESYADNVCVVGERFQLDDIRMSNANRLGTDASGLLICGINSGNKWIHKIKEGQPTKLYKVKGILGKSTDNLFITGKVVDKSSYKHVKHSIIDKICAAMQAAHQRKMFEICGVDIQSQAAYDLAVQGLLRPVDKNIPMLYSIKCVDLQLPEFTLEIACMNEDDMYLKEIIHSLGLKLHTNATCTQVHCIQVGVFPLSLALLQREWTVPKILSNMSMCKQIIESNKFLLEQDSPSLTIPTSPQHE